MAMFLVWIFALLMVRAVLHDERVHEQATRADAAA
jgi:hypothetical protein